VVFPAHDRVLSGRGARIFLVFLPCVSLGTPVVTVSKIRMVLSTVTAVWGLGHPNPDTVYILELVDQDETRGTAVTFCFWPLVSLHTLSRQFVNCPRVAVLFPRYLLCFLRKECRGSHLLVIALVYRT